VLETSYARPGHLVRRAYQISQALFLDETTKLGLTSVQYSALNAIAELPGIDQATLSGLIAFDKTTLVKVLDRMVTKELITRVRSAEDRRRQVLTATYSRAPLNPDLYAGVKSRVDAERKLARAREAA